MIKNRSLALKLSVLVTGCAAAMLALSFAIYYRAMSRHIVAGQEAAARAKLAEGALSLEARLGVSQEASAALASSLEFLPLSKDSLVPLLKGTVARNPDLDSITLLFEPYTLDPKTQYAQLRFSRNGLEQASAGADPGQYLQDEWYLITRELGVPVWGEPQLDPSGRIYIPYYVPFFRSHAGQKKLAGIAEADISLAFAVSLAEQIKLASSGHAMLVSRSGAIIYHPFARAMAVDSLFTLADEDADPSLAALGRRMIAGENGTDSARSALSGRRSDVYFRPVGPAGLSLAVLLPRYEILAPFRSGCVRIIKWELLALLVIALASLALGLGVARQLRGLCVWVGEMAIGKLDAKMPWRTSKDELGKLIRALQAYRDGLPSLMEKSSSGAAQRAAYEGTQAFGRQMRAGLMPAAFQSKEGTAFHACADSEGDPDAAIYDVFQRDASKTAFFICETDSVGPQAWLALSAARTLFRTFMRQTGDPARTLSMLNDELARSPEKRTLMTGLAAVYDSEAGTFSFANCGQPQPVILHGGELVQQEETEVCVLGAIESADYKPSWVKLAEGDCVFFHGRALLHAANENGEQFSVERIRQAVLSAKDLPPRGMVSAVLDAVTAFSGDKGLRSRLLAALRIGQAPIPEQETGKPAA